MNLCKKKKASEMKNQRIFHHKILQGIFMSAFQPGTFIIQLKSFLRQGRRLSTKTTSLCMIPKALNYKLIINTKLWFDLT